MSIQSLSSTAISNAISTPPDTSARSASAAQITASSAVAKAKPSEQLAVSEVQLRSAVDAANEFIKPINNSVEFSVDQDSGAMVVKVMDTSTKEVLRQIPSEEMLTIAKALDKIQGLLIKQQA